MTTAMVLEGVRDWLQTTLEITDEFCGIQPEGKPPHYAPAGYFAVDDDGVVAGVRESEYLSEVSSVEVSVWRRPGTTPKNRQGQLLEKDLPYISAAKSLDDMERSVIAALHKRWDFRVYLNSKFSLSGETNGEVFLEPLAYVGRSPMETITLPEANDVVYVGRRLRFTGLLRVSSIENVR